MYNFKKKENVIIAIALMVIVVFVCSLVDIYLGIGTIVGGAAIFFGWPALKELHAPLEGEKEGVPSFLDTTVLKENFQIPHNLPTPYAVLDIRGHILMYNKRFGEVFPDMEETKPAVEKLLKNSGNGEKTLLEIGRKYYQGALNHCEVIEENGAVGTVLTMTLVDVTEKQALAQQLEDQQTVIGMVFLDNYEDVVDNLDESRWPILAALIERKLNQLAQDVDGVIRKLEKDRFFLLVKKGKLAQLKEKKFDILNEIREISVGDHIPVTISMGIGIGKNSLDEAMQNAKAAIDLALGRGGDQVLIKEGENYLFYGGKTGEMGRNARIRARVKADALWELMGESSGILVMGHRNGDLDSMGSCMGVYAIARAMDKRCHIVMDDVGVGIRRLWENIVASGNHQNLTIKTPDALKMMDDKTLVIVVDTHRKSMVESPQVLESAKRIVLFDHHRKSTDAIDQAVLVYHEAYASSTSELITEMIQHIGKKVKLTNIEADALLAGITVDTKNFCVKTGAITFEAAGFLRRNGADSIRVRLLFQNDMDAYKAKASAVKDAELFMGNIAISVCPANVENSTLTAAQAADDLMNVTGVKASFVCCKVGDTVFISARSFGEINVQRIMERLGGGGHHTVSGGQLPGSTLEEAKEKIRHAIKDYLEEEA
ncbi:DHH family phosphoesterase [Anaerotignum sp. MB30-C6]|uniref:DHH family phosphoesterase n=1 Tax=Anaerotignum sp. MB30-C6 TaxID=3070814 RepID=UPI0027DD0114|nr:DHH family phosphoesterase [Anaerotignum sp. MB30-C6]WMI81513.1 DHH family phosphoesterase [Anaerotignum sp. MB30-C6]